MLCNGLEIYISIIGPSESRTPVSASDWEIRIASIEEEATLVRRPRASFKQPQAYHGGAGPRSRGLMRN